MALTRAEVLANILTRLTVIKNNKTYVDGKLDDADDARGSGDWNAAIGHLINAQSVAYNSLYWFAYRYDAPEPEYILWYFLKNFTIAEAELDWEAIITAWDNADLAGWARTIHAIDEMREHIWDRENTLGGPWPVFQ